MRTGTLAVVAAGVVAAVALVVGLSVGGDALAGIGFGALGAVVALGVFMVVRTRREGRGTAVPRPRSGEWRRTRGADAQDAGAVPARAPYRESV